MSEKQNELRVVKMTCGVGTEMRHYLTRSDPFNNKPWFHAHAKKY